MAKEHPINLDPREIFEIFRSQKDLPEKDYAAQFFWLLFLRLLDGAEEVLVKLSEGGSERYETIIEDEYKWSIWTEKEWQNKGDLIFFINKQLFPCLKGLAGRKVKDKIRKTFEKIGDNKITQGSIILEATGIFNEIKIHYPRNPHILPRIYKIIIKEGEKQKGEQWQGFHNFKPILESMDKTLKTFYNLIFLKYQTLFYREAI